MSDELYKCVITPNVRTIKLRSIKWRAKFIARTPVLVSYSCGPDGKPDGNTEVMIHGKTVFTRIP